MTIDLTTIRGYDPTVYENFQQLYTQATGKSREDVAVQIQGLTQNGILDFNDAISVLSDKLPALENPMQSACLPDLGGVPSMGANVLALLTQLSDDERRANAAQRAMATKAVVDQMNEKAALVRTEAWIKFGFSVAAGGLQIAGGAFESIKAGSALKTFAAGGEGAQAVLQTTTSKIAGQKAIFDGAATLVNAAKDPVSGVYESRIIRKDADIEQTKALAERLDSLQTSLKEVIAKARDVMSANMQAEYQTRQKLLC